MEPNAASSTPDLESKKIIMNVLKTCELDAINKSLQIPLDDFEDRASYYTGIPKVTLRQIVNKNTSAIYPKNNSLDYNSHIIILKCLCKIYERHEKPSFKLLLTKFNKFLGTMKGHPSIKDAEEFKQDVTKIGIEYQTIYSDTKLLMEDPKITFERYSYLKKITELREQNKYVFYYISEKIIDSDLNFNNPCEQNGQSTDICNDECILFHAVSKKGLLNGLFCYSATEDDLYKWVVDILLGSLYPGSVVILNNSPLHGRSKSKSITMFDTKTEMKRWLRKHNVPFSDAMKKSQLYQLVKNHPDIEEIPRVDQVIKANGHQVLRLPTHFEDLSPIENIWRDIKINLKTTEDLHDEILSKFESIPKETYERYETDITERENDLLLIDTEMDNALDKFLTDLKRPAGSAAMVID